MRVGNSKERGYSTVDGYMLLSVCQTMVNGQEKGFALKTAMCRVLMARSIQRSHFGEAEDVAE